MNQGGCEHGYYDACHNCMVEDYQTEYKKGQCVLTFWEKLELVRAAQHKSSCITYCLCRAPMMGFVLFLLKICTLCCVQMQVRRPPNEQLEHSLSSSSKIRAKQVYSDVAHTSIIHTHACSQNKHILYENVGGRKTMVV